MRETTSVPGAELLWQWDQTEAGNTIRTPQHCIQPLPLEQIYPDGPIPTTPSPNTASRTCRKRSVFNVETQSQMIVATWGEVDYSQCLGIEVKLTQDFENVRSQLASGEIPVDRVAVEQLDMLMELTSDSAQITENTFDQSLQIVQDVFEKNRYE
jgi:hypothetical protein